jgi:hypothetical protein
MIRKIQAFDEAFKSASARKEHVGYGEMEISTRR